MKVAHELHEKWQTRNIWVFDILGWNWGIFLMITSFFFQNAYCLLYSIINETFQSSNSQILSKFRKNCAGYVKNCFQKFGCFGVTLRLFFQHETPIDFWKIDSIFRLFTVECLEGSDSQNLWKIQQKLHKNVKHLWNLDFLAISVTIRAFFNRKLRLFLHKSLLDNEFFPFWIFSTFWAMKLSKIFKNCI